RSRCALTATSSGALPGGKIAASLKNRSNVELTMDSPHSSWHACRGGCVNTMTSWCSWDTPPGRVVGAVVDGTAGLAELEGSEGVDHDRQLGERLGAQARLDRRRLRSVGVAARVHRDRPSVDARALAGLVVAVDVEHDLVRVDVG